MLCGTSQHNVFHDGANVWHGCVYSRVQIGLIVGGVIGGLVIISVIIIVIVTCCRQRAMAEKETFERVAQIVGVSEVTC